MLACPSLTDSGACTIEKLENLAAIASGESPSLGMVSGTWGTLDHLSCSDTSTHEAMIAENDSSDIFQSRQLDRLGTNEWAVTVYGSRKKDFLIRQYSKRRSDQVAREIKRRGIAIVGFSDSWGDKMELYNVSSYFPKRLAEQGIPFILTRDHPATHGQWLAYEAQIAYHFGLDEEQAFRSILAEPARLPGLANRYEFGTAYIPHTTHDQNNTTA